MAMQSRTADEKEVARSVELGGMVFPVFDEKRKLKNYLFINARMLAGPGKDRLEVSRASSTSSATPSCAPPTA